MDLWYPKNLPVHWLLQTMVFYLQRCWMCRSPTYWLSSQGTLNSKIPTGSVILRDTHKGEVCVGFWVGDCTNSGRLHGGGSHSYTAFISMSRIFHVKFPKHQDYRFRYRTVFNVIKKWALSSLLNSFSRCFFRLKSCHLSDLNIN